MNGETRDQMLIVTDSFAVTHLRYDWEGRSLDVAYTNGAVYRYFDVAPEVYEDAVRAESIGRYIQNRVRNSYNYERV